MIGMSMAVRPPRQLSLLQQALSAIRRNGGTALYVPDDYGLVLGPELVTNGDFSAGTTGWATSSATLSVSSGELMVTGTATTARANQSVSLSAGKSYRFTATARPGTSGVQTVAIFSATYANNISFTSVNGTVTGQFTPLTTGNGEVWLRADTGTAYFDNISVREILSATTYIDSTGTQPVTAVGDLVGLLTDRSFGTGNLGVELVTNGDFSAGTTGWAKVFTGSISVSSGVLRVTNNDGTGSDQEKAFTVFSTVAGKTYALSMQLVTLSGGLGSVLVRDGSDSESGSVISSDSSLSAGHKRFVFVAQSSSTTVQLRLAANVAFGYSEWDNVSVREVLGNHASQPTTANKGILRRTNGRLCIEFDATDALVVTLPAGFSAATVIDARSTGQVTLQNQNIVGAYSIGPSQTTFGRIILPSSPSASDLALLQRFANSLAGL